MRGITGPSEVFEGNKGFMDTIAGKFEIDWSKEDLERVTHTILKKYNAEIHSQSSIEGILELKQEHGFRAKKLSGSTWRYSMSPTTLLEEEKKAKSSTSERKRKPTIAFHTSSPSQS